MVLWVGNALLLKEKNHLAQADRKTTVIQIVTMYYCGEQKSMSAIMACGLPWDHPVDHSHNGRGWGSLWNNTDY